MQRTREKSWEKTREVGRTPAPAGSHRHQIRAIQPIHRYVRVDDRKALFPILKRNRGERTQSILDLFRRIPRYPFEKSCNPSVSRRWVSQGPPRPCIPFRLVPEPRTCQTAMAMGNEMVAVVITRNTHSDGFVECTPKLTYVKAVHPFKAGRSRGAEQPRLRSD